MRPGTGLFADLYEFTMAQSYLEHGLTGEAVFDLHVRTLPPQRGFLVAAGVGSLQRRLAAFRFEEADLAFLSSRGLSDDLLDYLRAFRFTGRLRAIPEGRLCFPQEPLLQVEAPLPMAQLVETLVLNTIHLETLLASKAARCLHAARSAAPPSADGALPATPGLVDFGARRAHGHEAALAAARCAYLAGFDGTSLVEAARRFGMPCFGTMAHSYVEAFADEAAAFQAFARSFPEGTTLLVDTYDTLEGARRAARVAKALAGEGVRLGGVRLDSGDLAALAREVRGLLDAQGLGDVRIFASGGLDERAVARLRGEGVPIDAFGVGTAMVVSADLPALDLAYKLCSYEGEPVLKTSPGKAMLPGAKQVFRAHESATGTGGGMLRGDTIAALDERPPAGEGEPLLVEVAVPSEPDDAPHEPEALAAARARFLEEFARLPALHKDLERPAPYPVTVSPGLEALTQKALARARAGTHG